MQIQKSISLDEKTWNTIDELRNTVPRSRFVAKLINSGLENTE
jgi:hypothetical protein